ncbi:putative integral membrane protein [Mycetocola reblochoni REB411]|nr:putative integral membrane protein [Mycetocola reblochoni REB411]
MPGPLGILVPWIFSFMVCVLLAGRKLSVIRLSISVTISQLLFHVLFVLGTIEPSGTAVGHVHGAPLVLPGGSGVTEAVVADGTMWVGHLLAAIVTVLVAHRGERMLLALRELAIQVVRWVRRRVDAALGSPALLYVRDLGFTVDICRPLASRMLATLRGRAPPAAHAI